MTLHDFVAGMPKAENHIHQDGATSPESALHLAQRHRMKIPFSSPEEACQMFQYRDLGDFIRIIDATNAVIQDEEDIAYLVAELGRDAAAQNIRYREVMLSCDFHERTGIPLDAQMRGFIQGKRIAKERYGVEFSCIPELDRTSPPERNLSLVGRLEPWRKDACIVAVGLDSAEAGYPAHRHKEAFRLAKELGYHLTAHAGEAYGPVSILDALDEAGCDRIDHGVRAVEDPALVERLARENILLTVCPLSNLALKIFPDMRHHSIKTLMNAGVSVSINSDDPPFFRGNLNENYEAVAEAFQLSKSELYTLAKTAFTRSYAPQPLIDGWVEELDTYFKENDFEGSVRI